MKISGWHVDGFGHLCDLEAHDLPDGLIVLSGPNGAGKSTLVDFLTGMLFGFPRGNTRQVKRPPQRGGQHGGRMWLSDDHGEMLVLARSAKTTSIRRGMAAAPITDTEYDNLLGGANRRLFEAVFSVRTDDLQSLDALTDDELNDLVFSAGVVGAGRSATAVIDELESRRNELYRPKGRGDNYLVPQLRNRLRDSEEQLAAARRAAAAVPAMRAALVSSAGVAVELQAEISRLDRDEHHLATLLELQPSAIDAAAAEGELAGMADGPSVGAEVVARFEELVATALARDGEALQAAEAHALGCSRAEAIAVDAEALAVADLVDSLRQRRGLVERERQQGIAAVERAEHLSGELQRVLESLGSVDPAAMSDLGCDLLAGEALEAQATQVEQAASLLTSAEAAIAQAERDSAEAQSRLATRFQLASAAGPVDLAEADRAVEVLEARVRQAELAAAASSATSGAGSGAGWVPLGLVGLAVVFLAAGAWSLVRGALVDGSTLLAGGGFLVALAAVVAGPFDRRPAAGRHSRALGGASDDGDHGGQLVSALAEARRRREDLRRRADDLAAVERDRHEQAASGQARLDDVHRRRDAAAIALDEAQHGWAGRLAASGLPAGLAPSGAPRFVASMARARSLELDAAQARAEADRLAAGVAAFATEVDAVVAALGLAPSADPFAAVEMLAGRVKAAGECATTRRQADLEVVALGRVASDAQARALAARAAVTDLLCEAGAASPVELSAFAGATARATELRARVDAFDRSLALAVGAARVRQARAEVLDGDPEQWRIAQRRVAADRSAAHERRDVVVEEAGELRRRLATVEKSSDVAAIEIEVEGLRSELRAAVRRWTVLNLAGHLVSETLATYQRERQPRVLARAQELFDLVTAGEYPLLRTDDRTIVAVDRAGREVVASALSRGTREQLYLCLRFALAESFAERASLPIMLDDVLVDFDPGRATAVARIVASVAERHQVLAFTCHPWVRDLLVGAAAESTELCLESNTGELVPVGHGAGRATA